MLSENSNILLKEGLFPLANAMNTSMLKLVEKLIEPLGNVIEPLVVVDVAPFVVLDVKLE